VTEDRRPNPRVTSLDDRDLVPMLNLIMDDPSPPLRVLVFRATDDGLNLDPVQGTERVVVIAEGEQLSPAEMARRYYGW